MPLLCRNPLAQGVRNERQTDRKREEMGESGGRGRKAEKKKKNRKEEDGQAAVGGEKKHEGK